MNYTRRNVWDLENAWADPILWYARGVAEMKKRGIAAATSWNFYGAIHGIDRALWRQVGYLSPSDPMPSQANIQRFWDQCQHGTWYFLPWHRGYLLAFEQIIRAEVIKLGGPQDWALPYWNYFKPGQNALPPAFASPDWPGGNGNNPLFVPQRYGVNGDGNINVPLGAVNLNAMNDHDFVGVATGGSPGFGGAVTQFHHSRGVHGGIESQPHDQVHGLVGGLNPQNSSLAGLMSDPRTAALDPIFWLHHANIDRLWEVWVRDPLNHGNPTDADWINGPVERKFSMPLPDGSVWDYTPGDVTDLSRLNYTYDDLSPAVVPVQPSERLRRLGASPAAVRAKEGVGVMPSNEKVELVGANRGSLPVAGSEARTSVQLDTAMRRKVSASLAAAAESAAAPDRVFLNFENVRSSVDSTVIQVYVASPGHAEQLAGSFGLFGVSKASLPEGEHAGQGLTFVLEITDIVDALHLNQTFDVPALDVRLVPVSPIPDAVHISIGRVSIFRQGR